MNVICTRYLLPSATGNGYILTFLGDLSKYAVAAPFSQQAAENVAMVFFFTGCVKVRNPSIVQTDHGVHFVSEVFRHTCKLLRTEGFSLRLFTRNHRAVLAEVIAYLPREDRTNWDDWVPFAAHA